MTRARLNTPELVLVAVALIVGVAAIAFGDRGGRRREARASAVVGRLATIAHRVERIRGVRFKTLPRPVVVTAPVAR